jgi:hypothetical protein
MIKRTLLGFGVAVAFGLLLAGCDAIAIDEEEPGAAVPARGGLNTTSSLDALLIGMYDRLQNTGRYGQQFMLYGDALADNVNLQGGSGRYEGPLSNVQGAHLNTYVNPYSTINDANQVLANVADAEGEGSPSAVTAAKDRIAGEAHFLRALNYFDLVRTKGYEPNELAGVPSAAQSAYDGENFGVILRTDPVDEIADADQRARRPISDVYDLIESDLQAAIDSLGDAGEIGADPRRASKAAAHALLSRVYLYEGEWAASAAQAGLAIETAGVGIPGPDGYLSAWQAETYPGSIFELSMTSGQDGAATNSNGALQALTDFNQGEFSFEVAPSNDVIATFDTTGFSEYAAGVPGAEPTDARAQLFGVGDGFLYLRKYADENPNATLEERIPVIRIEEMYLNRAEAETEAADAVTAQAVEDLNTIRSNRGLDSLAVSDFAGKGELIDSILVERRREFLFEGKRFFTLKRRGRDIQKHAGNAPIPYEDYRVIAPLPQQTVDSNPKLFQNPGY